MVQLPAMTEIWWEKDDNISPDVSIFKVLSESRLIASTEVGSLISEQEFSSITQAVESDKANTSTYGYAYPISPTYADARLGKVIEGKQSNIVTLKAYSIV